MTGAPSGGAGTECAGTRGLPLDDVARRCREAIAQYERGRPDSGEEYCHELFRRAICNIDTRAWDAVFAQYSGLVLANVRRHPWAAGRGDDDYWVNRTFERFWKAIGPERFESFAGLPALLGYLKTCVHSAIVNDIRSQHGIQTVSDAGVADTLGNAEDTEDIVVHDVAAHELWAAIDAELQDETERVIARLSFMLEYKPAEIHEQRPDLFPTVGDVYRIKRNIIDRLRHSPNLRNFLE